MTENISNARLDQQLAFLLEADRLKNVLRRSLLTDASRRENTAEHSWHLALTAMVLAEYSPAAIDLPKVLRMLIVHDIVEIDAGDTFAYDKEGKATKKIASGAVPNAFTDCCRRKWEKICASCGKNLKRRRRPTHVLQMQWIASAHFCKTRQRTAERGGFTNCRAKKFWRGWIRCGRRCPRCGRGCSPRLTRIILLQIPRN